MFVRLKAYLAALLFFLVVDAIWIAAFAGTYYQRELGGLLQNDPNLVLFAVFYALYAAGIVVLAVMPALEASAFRIALINGGVLGGLAYGTFTVTNFAVIKGWSIGLVVSDIGWGITLTALAALVGYLAGSRSYVSR
ncbi:MAG: DUF2177 family protein [Pseudomonadota bacterium]